MSLHDNGYSLTFYDTKCCGMQEISLLSRFPKDPEAAMASFCKTNVESRVRFSCATAKPNTLYPLYIFSAGVYEDDHIPGTYKPNYGSQFADFIEANGLGHITTSPVIRNNAFHPDHSNQVWIWAPNTQAIYAWWKVAKERIVVERAEAETKRAAFAAEVARRQQLAVAKVAEEEALKMAQRAAEAPAINEAFAGAARGAGKTELLAYNFSDLKLYYLNPNKMVIKTVKNFWRNAQYPVNDPQYYYHHEAQGNLVVDLPEGFGLGGLDEGGGGNEEADFPDEIEQNHDFGDED